MTSGLPPDIWIHLFRPFPGWSWTVEPGAPTAPQELDLAGLAFPQAVQRAFGFLDDFGFSLTRPDA